MSSDMSTGAVGAAGVTATRVLLVDNHEMVVRGLAAAVGAEPDRGVLRRMPPAGGRDGPPPNEWVHERAPQ
jgi:hypothetical protein